MITILITGGSGMIGETLTNMLLKHNYKVIILSRSLHPLKKIPGVEYALWNVLEKEIDMKALLSANVIIHLAGAGVMDKAWTKSYKKEIIHSRIDSLELIIDKLRNSSHVVHTLISSSATGWYGKNSSLPHTEDQPAGEGFLSDTCKAWEGIADKAGELNIRVAKVRTGIVLSGEGGAYQEFRNPVRYGIAAILGNGKQVVSWIDISDLCRIYLHLIENELHGVYNAVAPLPVTNFQLVTSLAKMIKGKFYFPVYVPSFVLKIMYGERTEEIMKDADVSCKKIKNTGFTFLYPSIESSIRHIEML